MFLYCWVGPFCVLVIVEVWLFVFTLVLPCLLVVNSCYLLSFLFFVRTTIRIAFVDSLFYVVYVVWDCCLF